MNSGQILDEDASLVSDLIAENARLAQEVMLLRQSMNAAGAGAGTYPLSFSQYNTHRLFYRDPFSFLIQPIYADTMSIIPTSIILNQTIDFMKGLTGATATSSGATQHASMHMHGTTSLVPNQGTSHAAISMSPMHEEVIARQREALQIANNTNTSSSGTHTNQQHLQGLNMPMIEPRPGKKYINNTPKQQCSPMHPTSTHLDNKAYQCILLIPLHPSPFVHFVFSFLCRNEAHMLR